MELELQLQQALNELNSVQLIVQTLKKEHVQDNSVVTSSQRAETDLKVDNSCNELLLKGPKRRTERKMESINSNEQIILVNRYEALATESDTSDCRNKMKPVRENGNVSKLKVNTNSHKENMIYTEQDCLVIKEQQEGVSRKTLVHHNLQNPRPTCHQINRQN